MRRQAVFTIEELRHVSITCPRCATEVVLDMAAFAEPAGVQLRMAFAPRECPACKTAYDSALIALNDLQRAYLALSKIPGAVAFHAPAEP